MGLPVCRTQGQVWTWTASPLSRSEEVPQAGARGTGRGVVELAGSGRAAGLDIQTLEAGTEETAVDRAAFRIVDPNDKMRDTLCPSCAFSPLFRSNS